MDRPGALFAERVMAAMAKVPRHLFVPAGEEAVAYVNRPLAIGYGQTISQPYIVAVMSDLLDLAAPIGCLRSAPAAATRRRCWRSWRPGSTASRSSPSLPRPPSMRLRALGYANIALRQGDGYAGWPEEAPFDAIIVTAAPPRVPDALSPQLAPGGRLVLPIGKAHETQMLCRCVKAP